MIFNINPTNVPVRSITQMESETIDTVIVVDGDFGDPFVLWQEVVIPLIHITMQCKCIITPCAILEYHV